MGNWLRLKIAISVDLLRLQHSSTLLYEYCTVVVLLTLCHSYLKVIPARFLNCDRALQLGDSLDFSGTTTLPRYFRYLRTTRKSPTLLVPFCFRSPLRQRCHIRKCCHLRSVHIGCGALRCGAARHHDATHRTGPQIPCQHYQHLGLSDTAFTVCVITGNATLLFIMFSITSLTMLLMPRGQSSVFLYINIFLV